MNAEARRQQALLAALWHPGGAEAALSSVTSAAAPAATPVSKTATATSAVPSASTTLPDAAAAANSALFAGGVAEQVRGLAAYRGNARAIAQRALAAAFPTLQAMLGAEDFEQLAHEHWLRSPPQRGDLAEWGAELPQHLAEHPQLTAWPWLTDTARMDWACHQCERAADASFDPAHLMLMGSQDPDNLQLLLMPGLDVIVSRFPLSLIRRAHEMPPDDAPARKAAFAELREALQPGIDAAGPGAGETSVSHAVVVARKGWKATVESLPLDQAHFMRCLLQGLSLGAALHATEPAEQPIPALSSRRPGFDFTVWLTRALQAGWLHRANVIPSSSPEASPAGTPPPGS